MHNCISSCSAWLWRWRRYDTSECREPLTQWHSITSQKKTWIVSNITVRTPHIICDVFILLYPGVLLHEIWTNLKCFRKFYKSHFYFQKVIFNIFSLFVTCMNLVAFLTCTHPSAMGMCGLWCLRGIWHFAMGLYGLRCLRGTCSSALSSFGLWCLRATWHSAVGLCGLWCLRTHIPLPGSCVVCGV